MREIHILGQQTRYSAVRASDAEQREWLESSPLCPELSEYRIVHCGIMEAGQPFEVVRRNLSGTFFFACFEGEGQVLIDGAWRTVRAGQACVQPPFIPNALKASHRQQWKFCWVRYQEVPDSKPLVSLHAPALGKFNATTLRLAIQGLHAETGTAPPHAAAMSWIDLIHTYVLTFTHPAGRDERLMKVWAEVERDLEQDWTLTRLAEIGCVSREHLRRLCMSSLGRSPVQHVAFLRMQRAASLLRTTDAKIALIAKKVGYANPFSFSDAFRQWFGSRPSVYREQQN